jgi:hypothetical protein
LALAAEIAVEVDGTPGSNDMPGRIVFKTTPDGQQAPVESMRIDSSGNVGIGTSSPDASYKLEVKAALPAVFTADSTAVSPAYGGVSFYRPTNGVNNGNGISFALDNSSNTRTEYGYIGALINTNTAGSVDGSLYFATSTSNARTERARIDASGNLLVGTTSAGISNSISTSIEASGLNNSRIYVNHSSSGSANGSLFMGFGYGGGTIGSITQSSVSSVAYNTSSDYRLKEDVQPMVGASDRLMALKPVNFAWKVDGSRVDGFLAHEAQEVVPEAVTGSKDQVQIVEIKDEDGNVTGTEEQPVYQGIDQSKIVPLLTAALQEALTKIEQLEARMAILEGGAA